MSVANIFDLQDCGMPGSKSFRVSISGADAGNCIGVKAFTCLTEEVSSDTKVIPENASDLGWDSTNNCWVCACCIGCTPGRSLIVWPVERWIGVRAVQNF